MAVAPFHPSTWSERAQVPFESGNSGIIAECAIDRETGLLIASAPALRSDLVEKEWLCGYQWISEAGAAWTKVYDSWTWPGGPRPNDQLGYVSKVFVQQTPFGKYYFRFRHVSVTSFFVGNGTLFPGRIELEYSDDAINYWPTYTFAEWPHFPIPGNVGHTHAGTHVSATQPILIPGSGPIGQDADWIIVAAHASADGIPRVDSIKLYRSIDYGFTWEPVSTFPFGDGLSDIDSFTRNPVTGRLHVWITPAHLYSVDDGENWVQSGTPFFLQKVSSTHHPGSTMNVLRNGSFISPGDNIISCDGGETWGQPSSGLIVPTSSISAGVKLGPQELLAATRGGDFQVNIWWSDSGGEKFTLSGAIVTGDLNNQIIFMDLLPNGNPVLMTNHGRVFVSNDKARGTFSPRTFCPLASAALAPARPLPVCGHPLTTNVCG